MGWKQTFSNTNWTQTEPLPASTSHFSVATSSCSDLNCHNYFDEYNKTINKEENYKNMKFVSIVSMVSMGTSFFISQLMKRLRLIIIFIINESGSYFLCKSPENSSSAQSDVIKCPRKIPQNIFTLLSCEAETYEHFTFSHLVYKM